MKIETQIAKENIQTYNRIANADEMICNVGNITKLKTHKATCQRWLEFLRKHERDDYRGCGFVLQVRDKITDLKQAIKLYREAGV